jgi:hypothetical protein
MMKTSHLLLTTANFFTPQKPLAFVACGSKILTIIYDKKKANRNNKTWVRIPRDPLQFPLRILAERHKEYQRIGDLVSDDLVGSLV